MYPYLLLNSAIDIFPIFGEKTTTLPAILDYSSLEFLTINPRDLEAMNDFNESILGKYHASWALGGYLENRSHILSGTHILQEGRVFHLGIDIVFGANTELFSPLDGTVFEVGFEPGDGNYGGYLIMKYQIQGFDFFALYGHLSFDSIAKKTEVKKGEVFAQLGHSHENGNWFPHLHLQVFTGKDIDIWKHKGYCKQEDIATIGKYCPDPSFLLRYRYDYESIEG